MNENIIKPQDWFKFRAFDLYFLTIVISTYIAQIVFSGILFIDFFKVKFFLFKKYYRSMIKRKNKSI